jgi:isomerase DpgB
MVDESDLARLSAGYLELTGTAVLSAALIEEVTAVGRRLEGTDGTLLIRITGGHPDGAAWPYEVGVHTVNHWERALRRLERLRAVSIAVVDGLCQGPALDVLLVTDYRLSTVDTRLRIPSAAGGTWPGMALYRLANQLGTARARQAVLFGQDIPAVRAGEWGLLDEVVDEPVARVRDVVKGFAGLSGTEVSVRRQLLLEAENTAFEDALGTHLAACDRALRRTGNLPA